MTASETAIAFADDGLPDGPAADRDGGIWVAMYGAGEVRRYARDGILDTVITIPTRWRPASSSAGRTAARS